MSVLGLQGTGFPTARYPVGTTSRNNMRNVFGQSEISGKSSSTPSGNYHGTLKMGYLHSEFSPVSGQELHMKYDESSTDDDPVMYVEGKDIQGKTFYPENSFKRCERRKCHACGNDCVTCSPGTAGGQKRKGKQRDTTYGTWQSPGCKHSHGF